jgi:hypothetical protein
MSIILSGTNGISTSTLFGIQQNANGVVTLPYLPLICMKLSTSFLGQGLIPWDVTVTQQGITYNSTTRRFTVPITGKYRVNFNGFKEQSVTATRIIIAVNIDAPTPTQASAMIYTNVPVGQYAAISVDIIIPLVANDYFTICQYEPTGGIYSTGGDRFNNMNAHLIS